jgi:hypothetical protein
VPSPLKSSRLRRILTAYTVNRLGTWFGVVALMVAVFDQTHSAVAVAALLFAAQALPAFVVPAVVARVEASVRGSELSGLYFFEAVTTAALAVLLWHFWLPAVLLLAALDGTAALAAAGLLRAEVARAARDQVEALPERARAGGGLEEKAHEAERKANAALNVGFSMTFVLGPAIAGAMVAAAGAPAALFVDVGSFLVCGALLLDLHPHVEEAEGNSVRARLRAAWRHINEAPTLRGVLIAYGVALVFLESAAPIEVAYAKATLRVGDRGFGLLLTAWGVGAVLGSVVFARALRQSLGALLGAGGFAIGLAYLGFAAAPSLTLACIAALVGGVGNGLEVPSLISLVQRLTPQRLHGRLMGAVESLDALCLAIGLPLGGALVALSYPRLAFLVVGLGGTTASVALFRVSRGGPEHTAGDRERAGDGADPASLLHEPSRDGHAGRDEHRAHEARTEEIHSASPAPQAPQAP